MFIGVFNVKSRGLTLPKKKRASALFFRVIAGGGGAPEPARHRAKKGLFLGGFGEVGGVAPDHDIHDEGFVDDTDNNRAEDEGEDKGKEAGADEGKGEEDDVDSADIVENLNYGFNPHGFEGKELFEPDKELVFGLGFSLDKEEVDQDTTDNRQDGGDGHPNTGLSSRAGDTGARAVKA